MQPVRQHRHPYFELWLHDDEELAAILDAEIVDRHTLHDWPLSSVESIRTADGRRFIYKAQAPPTLEPDVYTHARSSLRPDVVVLPCSTGPAGLLMPAIEGGTLAAVRPEGSLLELADELTDAIAAIDRPDVPATLDLCRQDGWSRHADQLDARLRRLIAAGTFRRVDTELAAAIAGLTTAPSVRAALDHDPTYLHGDLSAENVFTTAHGYRIIDWQRPLRGPRCLDIVMLLETLGTDPEPHLGAGPVILQRLVQIAWFVACATDWYPPGAEAYDTAVQRLANDALSRAARSSDATDR